MMGWPSGPGKFDFWTFLIPLGVLAVPSWGLEPAARPQIEVDFSLENNLFDHLSPGQSKRLSSDVRDKAVALLGRQHPCFAWAAGSGGGEQLQRFQIIVERKELPGKITLRYDGWSGGDQSTIPGGIVYPIDAFVEFGADQLSDRIGEQMEKDLGEEAREEELQGYLKRVRFTAAMDVEEANHRVIVALPARDLSLVEKAEWEAQLNREVCQNRQALDSCQRLRLITVDERPHTRGWNSYLATRVEKIGCCPEAGWHDKLPQQLRFGVAGLWLVKHAHCSSGEPGCRQLATFGLPDATGP